MILLPANNVKVELFDVGTEIAPFRVISVLACRVISVPSASIASIILLSKSVVLDELYDPDAELVISDPVKLDKSVLADENSSPALKYHPDQSSE